MQNTEELRKKMLKLWALFEKGEISATEARVHVGFARILIETVKVEIAAAHLGPLSINALPLPGTARVKLLGGEKRKH